MNLTELSKEIHQDNKEKGFWDEERNVGEMLMLIVSELGEAMEALRKGDRSDYNQVIAFSEIDSRNDKEIFESNIKDTFEDEIADSIIRLLDLCGGLNIDIETHVDLKRWYNKLRPHKHGKKF